MALNDNLIAPERYATVTITDAFGNQVMSLRLAEFLEAIAAQANQNKLVDGTGSPEGVLSASPNQMYIDTNAAAGSNLYVKIAGSGSTGWTIV